MLRVVVAALALLMVPTLAIAKKEEKKAEATKEQIAKIDAALKADGCEGGDIDVGKDGSFEVDDVKCKDGQYDVKLDKDFKIMGKKKE
ncbi:MAG: hypothetical protein CTY20_04630 [Hyphomicrobium sp.]|nr:MAG: hypothetical protein CTY20_04630 [Hyphomicrobium sp.]